MVIVEYCKYGNIQNFLIKHRQYFIDQIIRDQDRIDPNILTKEQRWSNDSGYEYYNRYVNIRSKSCFLHKYVFVLFYLRYHF